jgi:hypothetical protein
VAAFVQVELDSISDPELLVVHPGLFKLLDHLRPVS